MWQPTHVQVTVQRARNLNFKGKNDTNDAFVVIGLGKDKFQTSIKEKAPGSVEWREECELGIPTQGNTAALTLTVYHRNALGLDEFLGQVQLPLSDFDVYERPRNRWHKLRGKPEKDRKKGEKERGELEVRVAFTVKSGSLLDVSNEKKKNKSITSLKNLGGSLMSLGNKEKANIKSFAKSVSHKIDKIANKPSKKKRKESRENQSEFPSELMESRQRFGDADPGVISGSDEDDFGFSEEVRVNTRSSSPYSTVSRGSSLQQEDEGIAINITSPHDTLPPPKPARLGGNLKEVPTIAVESPVPTPSPEPSPEPPTRKQPPPISQPPPSAPLIFPNLTPINLPGQNASSSSQGTSSPDSGLTNSLTSSNGSGGKDSLASRECSPEPIPAKRKVFPEPSPAAATPSVTTPDSFKTKKGKETPPTETVSSPSPKVSPSKSKGSQDSLVPAKPVRSARSTSLTDPPANSQKLLQAPASPNKSRSLSTSATPNTGLLFGNSKESKRKGSALAALASASSKMSMIDSEPALSTSSSRHNSEQTLGSVEVFPPMTPPTPSASVFSFSSDSGTPSVSTTPKESSAGPTPPRTTSSLSRGTPGLAERPGAAVVRSGSLHEKPTSQPVLDEWERKLYGRNAIVGSMENMTHSDSRSSLNTSQSSSTQDLHRIEEHRSRFPEMKVLTLDRKQKDDGDESSDSGKKRWKGGLKSKLFGSSKERIGEEDGRVVEGGNDRLPHPPTRQSRLPQEIHDKFAGKSREDLMETIVNLQALLEKNARHTRDLEDYIDGLLLRVMETTPQLLQASNTKSKFNKVFGL